MNPVQVVNAIVSTKTGIEPATYRFAFCCPTTGLFRKCTHQLLGYGVQFFQRTQRVLIYFIKTNFATPKAIFLYPPDKYDFRTSSMPQDQSSLQSPYPYHSTASGLPSCSWSPTWQACLPSSWTGMSTTHR